MTKKIQALGYVKGSVIAGTPLLPENTAVTGHEFHYSRLLPDTDVRYAMALTRGKGIDSGRDGLIAGNALGTYTHAYFTKKIARGVVGAAMRYSRQ
jgi:cobyrinic acid a,c-diamide synthase